MEPSVEALLGGEVEGGADEGGGGAGRVAAAAGAEAGAVGEAVDEIEVVEQVGADQAVAAPVGEGVLDLLAVGAVGVAVGGAVLLARRLLQAVDEGLLPPLLISESFFCEG